MWRVAPLRWRGAGTDNRPHPHGPSPYPSRAVPVASLGSLFVSRIAAPPGEAGRVGPPPVLRGGPGAEPPARFILTLRQSTKRCSPKWLILSCACKQFSVVKSGCMNKDCEVCADVVTDRRASRARARLDAGRGDRPILQTVLTVPPELRQRYADVGAWRSVLRKMWRVLEDGFGALFGCEATHPVGDDPEVFHPHANFLWVQKVGFRPFIDVERLRRLWAGILGAEVVDVHHSYFTSEAKIAHRVRYVARVFPGWSLWVGNLRWYGRYPRHVDVPVLCPKCGEPYLYVGVVEHDWLLVHLKEHPYLFRFPGQDDS